MKKTILICALLSIVFVECKKTEDTAATTSTTTTPTTTSSTFTLANFGTFTVPSGSFGVATGNTTQLQFVFGGTKGSVNGGGNIYFPLGAASGTYMVTTTKTGLAANQVYLDMESGPAYAVEVAQSGTVALTITGTKYKIAYSNLPDAGTDKLSASLSN